MNGRIIETASGMEMARLSRLQVHLPPRRLTPDRLAQVGHPVPHRLVPKMAKMNSIYWGSCLILVTAVLGCQIAPTTDPGRRSNGVSVGASGSNGSAIISEVCIDSRRHRVQFHGISGDARVELLDLGRARIRGNPQYSDVVDSALDVSWMITSQLDCRIGTAFGVVGYMAPLQEPDQVGAFLVLVTFRCVRGSCGSLNDRWFRVPSPWAPGEMSMALAGFRDMDHDRIDDIILRYHESWDDEELAGAIEVLSRHGELRIVTR